MFGPLCPGHLAEAAAHLAEFGRRVVIVTGFYIPAGDPPAAETDGPPGALVLAQTLLALGIEAEFSPTRIVSAPSPPPPELRLPDRTARAIAAAASTGTQDTARQSWRSEFLRNESRQNLSHLIAIERVGPSHTADSLARQPAHRRDSPCNGLSTGFPCEQRDCCHNMRGENIDRFAGDLHRLFEEISEVQPGVKTIGIGDGANEIGMGAVPWEELERRLSGEQSARVPCRIATDWNIVAGTSNWGGYALAAAVALLRGQIAAVAPFDSRQQQTVLEAMVEHGPAVDGVTKRREPTVDGLPFLTYIQPWEAIREKLKIKKVSGTLY